MISYTKGNILLEQADAIVNTVNCVGVMGRGIALQFKKLYPENFKEYEQACKKALVKPGEMFIHNRNTFFAPKYIINFPTKRHWKGKSQIQDIKNGLESLAKDIVKYDIKSIAIPPLGCGLGGLNWDEVKPLIEEILGNIEGTHVIVYEPNNTQHEIINNSKDFKKLTPCRAALIELVNRYINGLLDPFISLLEIHKLMYFLQETGQPLKLTYKKHIYGPYAENLRHVLNVLEGNYISGYNDGGDNPEKPVTLIPGAVEDAKKIIETDPNVSEDFNKVAKLIDGFETSFGLELLSTVHWVVQKENNNSLDSIVKAVYNWNKKKNKFSERQIEVAYIRLQEQNWI